MFVNYDILHYCTYIIKLNFLVLCNKSEGFVFIRRPWLLNLTIGRYLYYSSYTVYYTLYVVTYSHSSNTPQSPPALQRQSSRQNMSLVNNTVAKMGARGDEQMIIKVIVFSEIQWIVIETNRFLLL